MEFYIYWLFSYNFLINCLSCTLCMPFKKMSHSKSHYITIFANFTKYYYYNLKVYKFTEDFTLFF